MRMRLFVPDGADQTTGGHAFNRRLLAALNHAGHDAAAVAVAGRHPLADDAARQAAALCWRACPDDAVRLIDGAALAAFLPLRDALVARRAAVLVHHPTSLEAGFDETAHAALRAAEQAMLPRLDRIVVKSDAMAQQLAESFNLDRARVAVLPPGFGAACRARGSGEAACHILSLGALVPRKGHDVLLRALARLFDLDWRLTIAGTPARHPAHADALRTLAGDLGIAARVRFAGVPDDPALDALWQQTDLFALATHWEDTSWAAMQAFRHGVPAVVGNGGAAAEGVSPHNGLVVAPGEVDALSKALRRVIFDKGLRASLAEAAWQTGRALPGWDETATRLVQLVGLPPA